MARKVVASPEAMMQSLFWPEVDLRDASEFTIKKYSQISVVRPKFLFKNETSGDITTLPADIPSDLKDSEFVQGMIYYFNGRTRKPSSAQVFPIVVMATAIHTPPSIYICTFNSGSAKWSAWYKVMTTQELLRILTSTMKTLCSMSFRVAATMESSCSCLSELPSGFHRLTSCEKHHLICEVM